MTTNFHDKPASERARLPDPVLARQQAEARWTPLDASSVPGFAAQAHDLQYLNACGMQTGIKNGLVCIESADLGRARELIDARRTSR